MSTVSGISGASPAYPQIEEELDLDALLDDALAAMEAAEPNESTTQLPADTAPDLSTILERCYADMGLDPNSDIPSAPRDFKEMVMGKAWFEQLNIYQDNPDKMHGEVIQYMPFLLDLGGLHIQDLEKSKPVLTELGISVETQELMIHHEHFLAEMDLSTKHAICKNHEILEYMKNFVNREELSKVPNVNDCLQWIAEGVPSAYDEFKADIRDYLQKYLIDEPFEVDPLESEDALMMKELVQMIQGIQNNPRMSEIIQDIGRNPDQIIEILSLDKLMQADPEQLIEEMKGFLDVSNDVFEEKL